MASRHLVRGHDVGTCQASLPLPGAGATPVPGSGSQELQGDARGEVSLPIPREQQERKAASP